MHIGYRKQQTKMQKRLYAYNHIKTFILHKKVHILCSTSYELNKNVSKTVKK